MNAAPCPPAFDLSGSTGRSLQVADLLALARDNGDLAALRMDYADPAGLPLLRAAIAARLGLAPDDVVTLPGTMLGLFLLAWLVRREGAEALLLTPCYAPMRAVLREAGLGPRTLRLRFTEGYRLDPDRLSAALHPGIRLVCLADPQNPSGVRLPRPALLALLDAMARRAPHALLFLDEAYREASPGGVPPPSAAGLDPRIVTAASLSKAHGVPGLRVGWLTLRDAALRRRLVEARQALLSGGAVLDESLAALLLRQGGALLAARNRALGEALGTVLGWQAREAGRLDIVRPEGGALCCLRLAPARFDGPAVRRFWAALPLQRIRLAPGPWFGEARRVFRLGFGDVPPALLPPALLALSQVMDGAIAGPSRA